MTVEEAAKRKNCSRATIQSAIHSGKFTIEKKPGKIKWYYDIIDDALFTAFQTRGVTQAIRDPKYMTQTEAAKIKGVRKQSMSALVKSGVLNTEVVNGHPYILRDRKFELYIPNSRSSTKRNKRIRLDVHVTEDIYNKLDAEAKSLGCPISWVVQSKLC